ncbi:hypothetical protein QUY_1670 [Clostridioides difficile P71]|nr:hypothetical protein QUY_1670 [Clostridioides difficile P71]
MIKNNYILGEKMLYKLLGYFTYTCCKFTYHVVNIKRGGDMGGVIKGYKIYIPHS